MEYKVIITRKNIKNIILKVKNTREVLLSVPKNLSEEYIKDFLDKRRPWILKNLEKYSNFPLKPVDKSYKNGDNIEYLGRKYKLQIFSKSNNFVSIENDLIKINYTGVYSSEKIEKLLYKWYSEQAKKIFLLSMTKYSKIINEHIFTLKIRKMKTKWGSCRPNSKIITLNLELIKKPIEAIDYVALHELAHFKYPHHKKEFWDFISLHMSDWKKRKELLLHV